jgi:putative membrane protein
MKSQLTRFILRWFVNSLGLWIAQGLFETISFDERLSTVIIAGLVLSLVNALIKPLIVLLTLPAVLLSLGLFMIVINGFVVWLASVFYGPLEVASFGGAVLAGLVIGLVNYALSTLLEDR